MYHVPVTEIMLHLTPRQADALARATALQPPLDPVDAIQRGLTARANPPQRTEAVPPRRSTGPLDAQAIAPGEVGVVLLNAGELLTIQQLAGNACVDVVAWAAADLRERLSVAHSRPTVGANPTVGAVLRTNPPGERPLLAIVEDTAPGHDLLYPACSAGEFATIGCAGSPSCDELHRLVAASIGAPAEAIPEPLNLWFRSATGLGGALTWTQTPTRPGDRVVLRAEQACHVATNPCVSDVFGCSPFGPRSIQLEVASSSNLQTLRLCDPQPTVEQALELPDALLAALTRSAAEDAPATLCRALLIAGAVAHLEAAQAGGR